MKRIVLTLLILAAVASFTRGGQAVWQWSIPMGEGRAFLWIPEDCRQVRAVVVAQHNMIEQGILEHPTMRAELASLGIAEVFVAPPFDRVFNFEHGAGERFEAMMRDLSEESGYSELASAPVVPIGHSACASYPWNFAAWNPDRTLAVLSVKGDAPQTPLTGSGAPNPEWGARGIDGIPGLMVMSEAEWWDARLAPALAYAHAHPSTPITLLADVGHGHFDASEELIHFLALFIRKAAEARLTDDPRKLRAIDVNRGWRMDRWRGDEPLRARAAVANTYQGNPAEAFWCFDEEMARDIETFYSTSRGKKIQQVDFVQKGEPAPISTTHTGVELSFSPEADGISFTLAGEFIVPLPPKPPVAAKDRPPPPTTTRPAKADNKMHAAGDVRVSVITGPAEQTGPNSFRVAFNRTFSTTDSRDHDVWLVAGHPGNAVYKSVVQQALLKIPHFKKGAEQTITFPRIADQKSGTKAVKLAATSDAGLLVGYYVREGPAYIEDGVLHLTSVPPRAKWPMRVTVVAWQLGRGSAPEVRSATPVELSFFLLNER